MRSSLYLFDYHWMWNVLFILLSVVCLSAYIYFTLNNDQYNKNTMSPIIIIINAMMMFILLNRWDCKKDKNFNIALFLLFVITSSANIMFFVLPKIMPNADFETNDYMFFGMHLISYVFFYWSMFTWTAI